MRGNELLDAMEQIDLAFVEEADRQPVKKTVIWTRWTAMAACFCLIIGAAWLWTEKFGFPDDLRRQEETGMDSTNAAMEWIEIGEVEIVTEPYLMTANDDQSILDGKPMISGFGESVANVDMSVTNGGIWYSPSLEGAMDHYGDTVNYRVLVELFRDGVQIASGGSQAVAEAARLSELGYIVAMETSRETVTDGEITTVYATYYFTIHATYEQMRQFQPAEDLGYKFMLYDEVYGSN